MTDHQRSTIIIIENDLDIQEMIAYNFRQEGYRVFCSMTGEDGLHKIRTKKPNIVLLDWMLPGMSGIEVCKAIREDEEIKKTKILMLTAKSEEANIILGLELGADDYMTKPFSTKVLLAKVNSIIRREQILEIPEEQEEDIDLGHIQVQPGRRNVIIHQTSIKLTASEFSAFKLLAQKPEYVVSRSEIVEAIHGPGHVVSNRAIDVMMVSLRKKLGEYSDLIETIRGVGYRLKSKI